MVLAAGVSLFGVLFFVWLNRKDSSLDERSYDQGFDPGDMVAPYRIGEEAHPEPGRLVLPQTSIPAEEKGPLPLPPEKENDPSNKPSPASETQEPLSESEEN